MCHAAMFHNMFKLNIFGMYERQDEHYMQYRNTSTPLILTHFTNLKAINIYVLNAETHTYLQAGINSYLYFCHIMVTGFNYRSSRIVCGSNRHQIELDVQMKSKMQNNAILMIYETCSQISKLDIGGILYSGGMAFYIFYKPKKKKKKKKITENA